MIKFRSTEEVLQKHRQLAEAIDRETRPHLTEDERRHPMRVTNPDLVIPESDEPAF